MECKIVAGRSVRRSCENYIEEQESKYIVAGSPGNFDINRRNSDKIKELGTMVRNEEWIACIIENWVPIKES